MKCSKIILLLALVNTGAVASQYDSVIDSLINQMKSSGDLKPLASCIDVPEKQILKVYKKQMTYCFDTFANNDSKLEQCFDQELMTKIAALSPKFESCKDKLEAQDAQESADAPDNEPLSAQELEQFSKQLGQSFGELDSNIDAINLPIYQGAKLKMHYPNGMDLFKVKTLPVATFELDANIEQVVSFYKKALPDFEMQLEAGIYQFAKKLPKQQQSLMEFMQAFSQMPHISVMEAVGGKTLVLEISYQ